MNKFNYDGPRQFKPISAWGYIGYSILFAIPIIGFILLIVFSFSDGNINRRSYARSYFCWLLIGLIVSILIFTGILTGLLNDSVKAKFSTVQDTVQNYTNRILNKAPKPAATLQSNDNGVSRQAPTDNGITSNAADSMVQVQIGSRTLEISASFKEAVDSYETFFNDYIDAITSQNVLQMSSLALKYAKTLEEFEQIEDKDMSEAEMAYYTEVHARIMGKLASVQ